MSAAVRLLLLVVVWMEKRKELVLMTEILSLTRQRGEQRGRPMRSCSDHDQEIKKEEQCKMMMQMTMFMMMMVWSVR